MKFLDRFFGPSYEKELKALQPLIEEIGTLEKTYTTYDADQLKQAVTDLKTDVVAGADPDTILPKMAALTRIASERTVGLRHYDEQLVGGILLHRGKITEMRTGEGKTLVATIPAGLNALTGKGVHIVTVNDYLSRRDAVWMGQVYDALGLSVAVINHETSYFYDPGHTETDAERDAHGSYKVFYEFLRPCTRQEAYAADITYGTNNEFGFDFLRDNIEFEVSKLRQRSHAYAIVDEIDSILIDEARTPLIISAPATGNDNLYETFAAVARQLKPEEHYTLDEKLKAVELTDAGIEATEKMLGIENIYTDKGIKYVHHLETAVKAKGLYTKDKEYVVRDKEVVIVDEFTGRLQPGRRWSDGLHQAVEAKEGVTIQKESRTYAQITYQNYFKMYDKLSGMTGTAMTSEEEFYSVYGLEVIPVPPHEAVQRIDYNDLIFQTVPGKYAAITQKVKDMHEKGQPVLIGTASIDTNEALANALTAAGVKHKMLNAKNHESEAEIIADAGKKGAVTLATNMAGRGVDIKLGGIDATSEMEDEIRELGGLFVLGTERHEARRIDNQLRGRAGRQGDPGATLFMVSMEDQLMRVFGGERMKSLMGTFKIPEDQPIENRMISKQLESAQSRIEGMHFDSRKQVLAYDNVQNAQRQIIYERRQALLHNDTEEIEKILQEVIAVAPDAAAVAAAKETEYGRDMWLDMVRTLALQMIDILWVEHLEVMQYTRSSVNLRAYGQKDPLNEYRREGARLFSEMQEAVLTRMAEVLPNIQPKALAKEEETLRQERAAAQRASGGAQSKSAGKSKQQTVVKEVGYGRNDIVTIQKGKETKELKYKKAETLLADGWEVVTPLTKA